MNTVGNTRQITADNIEELFRHNSWGYDTAVIKTIAVCSTQLSAPFQSYTPTVRSFLQRQFLPVDYHAFVVLQTNDQKWWAVDKMKDGIFISCGTSFQSVAHYFKKEPHVNPVLKLVKDQSDSSLNKIVRRLKGIVKHNRYDAIENNCQHFAKEIFNKFAEDKTWKYSTLTDVTTNL